MEEWWDPMIELYQGNCIDYIDKIEFDVIITDPPYPDYHQELYGEADITWMDEFDCLQLIFWSAKAEFPLDYTAIHIWDKWIGVGSQYERIFERAGNKEYKVFKHAAGGNPYRKR